ncbi:hypothetical protein HN51_070145 [Arachis hypogaea]|uniref:S-protein homolog n=1 Tax=Arachis hypogaea TaxID=3818 RepID=A0A444Z356_ARAHY|nr:hypothetical protein Ahy_B05g076395 [Arachis hypogaea]
MGDTHGIGKSFLSITLLWLILVPSMTHMHAHAHGSLWDELLHPILTVTIINKIPNSTVCVKCISSEDDIKEGLLNSSSTEPFSFTVKLKLLTTIRYNCLLRHDGEEIGQFLGFRSGSYCEKGCVWEIYEHYALRTTMRYGYVNHTYKPIGSPDDHTYDYT